MTRGFVVLASILVVATPAAADPTAREILAKVEAKYAAAKTYADRGEVTTTVARGAARQSLHVAFASAFVRPGRLRFELHDDDDKRTYVFHTARDGARRDDEHYARPADALDVAAGLSGGAALDVAQLVWPTELGTPFTSALVRPHLDGNIDLAGAPTWKISATRNGGTFTVWIDRRAYTVRRIEQTRHFEAKAGARVDLSYVATYDPHLDEPIADAAIAPAEPFIAPPWLGVQFAVAPKHVFRVLPATPAAAAGIADGDDIVAVDGHWFESSADVAAYIRSQPDGAHVRVLLWRGGRQLELPVTLSTRPSEDAMATALVGRPAPAFSLPALAAGSPPLALAQLRGHVVIVDFWATWCGPCLAMMPRLDALRRKYEPRGVRVIGISDEDAPVIRAFLAKHAVGYTIAVDADDRASGDYGVTALPTMFVIDKTGVVRSIDRGVTDLSSTAELVEDLLK